MSVVGYEYKDQLCALVVRSDKEKATANIGESEKKEGEVGKEGNEDVPKSWKKNLDVPGTKLFQVSEFQNLALFLDLLK